MKLNFNFTLTGLDETPLTDVQGMELHAGRTAASIIMQSIDPGIDTMKKYDWATQLYKHGEIDLDKQGQADFKKLFENIPNVSLIVRGKILDVITKRTDELTEK
jgi:hypothetical protein